MFRIIVFNYYINNNYKKKLFKEKNMNLPIPDHLKNYLLIDEKKSTKRKLIATLLCCDNNNFLIKKSQNDLVCIVSAVCTKCNTEIIIFDSRTHGWNADVCIYLVTKNLHLLKM